jgi:hypothetical protein
VSTRLPSLGEEANYFQQEMRFQAYAGLRKFLASIDPEKVDPHLPTDPDDAPANDFTNDQKKVMEKNTVAMNTLTLAFTSQSSMGFILKSRTAECPGGLAWKVMALMKERYTPKDRVSRLEMRRQLAAVKMDDGATHVIMVEEFHKLANIFNDLSIGVIPMSHIVLFNENSKRSL